MKRTKIFKQRNLCLSIFVALFNGKRIRFVKAEEASILQQATVPTLLQSRTPDGLILLNGSFKSYITPVNTSNPIDVEVALNLPQAETVITVFMLASPNNIEQAHRIGGCEIILVNGASNIVAERSVYDTGIYELDTPAKATSIIIRRQTGGGGYDIYLNPMRVYQSTNLLNHGATLHYATQSNVGNEAQNLFTNLESRSSSNLWNARLNDIWYGARASYKSCYVTNQTSIAADGNQMKFVIDLQLYHLVHAILIADDLGQGRSWDYFSEDKVLQNLQIYIGNDSEIATNNNLCPGGPYLRIDDPSNWLDDPDGANYDNYQAWKYGLEAWCNVGGRYVHVVADLASKSEDTFTQSICSLSVFGTIYQRSRELESSLFVVEGQNTATVIVPHIFADPTKPIGNVLAINLREKSSMNAQISRTSSESILTFDTQKFVAGTTYDLVIESFDQNSTVQSTLKTDTIKIFVQNPKLPEPEKIEPKLSFKDQLQLQVIELGKAFSWTIPEISDGFYKLQTITHEVQNSRIANNLSFDQASRNFSFSNKKVTNSEDLVDKLFLVYVKLVDTNKNVVFQVQMLQIVAGQLDETKMARDEQLDETTQASKAEQIYMENSSTRQQHEMLVKIKQTLIDRYSFEQAFKDLNKLEKNQKSDLDSQIKQGNRPLELRVGNISNIGKVEVTFNKKIKFPDNFGQVIRDSQVSEDHETINFSSHKNLDRRDSLAKINPVVEILMIEPGEIVSNNLKYWSIDSVSEQKIVFKLHFANPLAVSQYGTEKLLFHFHMSQWATEEEESLPELVVRTREIQRQVVSEKEAENISSAGNTGSKSTATMTAVYTAIMVLIQSSLYKLWSAINSQQVNLQISLMKNVKFPANAAILQSILNDMAKLNLFPTEWLEELIYYLPELTPFNINFEAIGIESNPFISNTGCGIWIIAIFLIVAMINLAFYSCKRIWNKFGKPIFFNGFIRTFMQMFQDLVLLAILNLATAEWDSQYDALNFSNVLSVIIISISGVVLLFLIIWLCLNRKKMNDKKFKERSGALVESTNSETHKWSIIAVLVMFFIRRISFVMSVIFIEDFVWGQLQIQAFFSIGMLIILWHQPMQSKSANYTEVFNELCNLVFSYFAMCFTDFVLDPKVKSDLGYPYMGLNSTMIFVHLSMLMIQSIKALILKCKMSCKKSNEICEANKIKERSTLKSTQEQASTSNPKKRAKIEIASLPKTELLVIEEEEEDHERSDESDESKSQEKELDISEQSVYEAKEDMVKQTFTHIAKDTKVVQDINAYIKEENKNFEDADNIIAEFLPQVKDTGRLGLISDTQLIHNEDD